MITLNQLFEHYKQERLPSQATIASYKSLLNVFSRDTGCSHISDINHYQLLTWRNHVIARASITTWNTYLRQMRALLQLSVELGYLKTNPFLTIKTITDYTKKPKTINLSLISEMIAFCKADPNIRIPWFWEAVINTLYYTGMRRSQLVGLKWGDVNFK